MKSNLLLFVLLICLGLLLALAATAILRGGRDSQALRARVRAATGIDERVVIASRPDIRAESEDDRGLLRSVAQMLGYNPELPSSYAASLPLTSIIAVTLGLLAFWRIRLMFGDLAALIGAVTTSAGVARILFRRKTNAYTLALFNQIPDTISLILRAVRAGLPVGEAIRNVSQQVPSPSKDEFSRVSGEMALGIPIDAAIWNLYGRTQIREYAFFAVTLGLQGQTGGNLGETLQNLSEMVRRRVSMAAKARALAAEARMSAAILACLPFFTSAAILVVNPAYLTLLFTDKRGPAFLSAFAILLTLGLLVIRWMIRRATQD